MIKNSKVDINVLKELHDILHKSYPIINRNNVKLLSIGFFKDLQKTTGLSKELLKTFFRWYCNINYRKLVKVGESRFNLQGEIVDTVTQDEEDHATRIIIYYNQQQIEKRIKKRNEEMTKILQLRKEYRNQKIIEAIEKYKLRKNKKSTNLNNN